MTVLLAAVLLLVAAGGTAVVLTRDPLNQAIMASFFGLLLGLARRWSARCWSGA